MPELFLSKNGRQARPEEMEFLIAETVDLFEANSWVIAFLIEGVGEDAEA